MLELLHLLYLSYMIPVLLMMVFANSQIDYMLILYTVFIQIDAPAQITALLALKNGGNRFFV